MVYEDLGDYTKAINYFEKAIPMMESIGSTGTLSSLYTNIGVAYVNIDQPDKALEYYFKSITMSENSKDYITLASAYTNVGSAYQDEGNYNLAIEYLKKSNDIAMEIHANEIMIDNYKGLSEVYSQLKDFKQALSYHSRYTELREKLLNESNNKVINEMQTKFDSEKKDKELIKKETAIKKEEADVRQRSIERNGFLVGFVLIIILAIFVFKSYRNKQQANIAVMAQKEIIEEKNKDITDSIQYAQKIQQALLPSEGYIHKTLKRLLRETE